MGEPVVKVVKGLDKKSYDPCVWRLFGLMQHKGLTMAQLSETSGVASKTLKSWLYKLRSPTLTNFRAAANAMGYEIVLVPLGSVDRHYGPSHVEFKKTTEEAK